MDAAFWALVALVIFLGIVIYLKVPGMINKSLDERAERIRNELDEARRLREEAQQLLAEYQRKRKDAEKEAGELIAAAEHEAAGLVEQYVDQQGQPAMRLAEGGLRVARQLTMLGEDGQDALMKALLGEEG